jgi:uncharacterized protein (DUF1697 family)
MYPQHDKNGCIKTTLENIGFTKVQTYIQSGNVFVTTEEENAAKVGFIIKQELFKVFGGDVPVIILSAADLSLFHL